ncbi:MAG TPA: PLP-dependent aspartate aminotransferase family protein [Ktedonobacteraceae bacterium]|nr:PLP-dependent aspartate aminotransferase family protein [Ktedonobacteraceae bacterium]
MKEAETQNWSLDTLFVHGGEYIRPSNETGAPTIQPIYTSTTFLHGDTEQLDQAFDKNAAGEQAFVYARQGNPNAHALEHVLSMAEGGVGAVVMGSGMAAIQGTLMATGLTAGAKILVAQDLYGATASLLRTVFAPLGISVVFKDLCCTRAGEIIREEEPDVVLVETISNPLVKVTDLDAISTASKEVGAISVIDSTFATPYLVQPLAHGFDIVIHSATKYIGGHGDSTAGVTTTSKKSLLQQLRSYSILLGAMLGPFESYLTMRGLKTLALRMERHCANALQVARFLSEHSAVERVHYPGLENHPQHELASKLFRPGLYGGLLSFELKQQSKAAAARFMDELSLCLPVTTLGDIHSQVCSPAISSHRSLTQEERQRYGITDGCIRLSVGIEDAKDIIADLDQALQHQL